MKMLAQLMVSRERHVSTGAEEDVEMAQLYHAINKGDVDAVKAVCEADRSLVSTLLYFGIHVKLCNEEFCLGVNIKLFALTNSRRCTLYSMLFCREMLPAFVHEVR